MDLAAPVGAGLKGSTLGPRFGTGGTPRPGRLRSWSEAARSGSGMASPVIHSQCCHLRKWLFPVCLWAGPFQLGIR